MSEKIDKVQRIVAEAEETLLDYYGDLDKFRIRTGETARKLGRSLVELRQLLEDSTE